MSKILITGGAGYIGSILTPTLLQNGHEVTVIDNFLFNQGAFLDCIGHKKLRVIRGDARNEELVKKHLNGIDFILPLAALVGAPLCDRDPIAAKTTNLEAIKTLLQIREKNQKIIYPTTNSGYGTKSGETYCTEETPLEPISLYGRTKSDAERYLLAASKSGKEVITLRLATVFGISPRMRTDLLVNDFVIKAMRDGYVVMYEAHFKRNYIHIRDVARCFEHCIINFEKMKNQTYNVGLDDANLSKMELAQKIKSYIPKFEIIPMEIGEDPDKRNYIVSNKKIMSTGFIPEVSLDEGIQELMRGYAILLKDDPYKNV